MVGNALKLIQFLYLQDKDKQFEVREYKKRRNNNQNAKYWKLLYELSLSLKIGIGELHFHMLKNYSQRYEICVPKGTEIRGVEYFEKKSTIKRENGSEFETYHVYTPSHELKENEFALLMSGLIEECKNVGIETRSPDEIKRDEVYEKI